MQDEFEIDLSQLKYESSSETVAGAGGIMEQQLCTALPPAVEKGTYVFNRYKFLAEVSYEGSC